MPYKFVYDLTMEDVAFEVSEKTLEDLFKTSSDALMLVMIEDLEEIALKARRTFEVTESSLEYLLYQYLSEFIYYKDAEQLLLRCREVSIKKVKDQYHLRAETQGEAIDRARHRLKTDVKAVTMYRLEVKQQEGVWRAVVIVDV